MVKVRDIHQVPGIRDQMISRHVGASGPKSRQALVSGTRCPYVNVCGYEVVRGAAALKGPMT